MRWKFSSLPHPYNKKGDGPEGPEIKIFAKKLKASFKGKKLLEIRINHKVKNPYATNPKGRYLSFRERIKGLEPHLVKDVKNKGKWLYFELEGKFAALGIHHGMEGSWCEDFNKHVLLSLIFEDRSIHFQDSRRFATFSLLTEEELSKNLQKIGPDIFYVNFSTFKKQMKTRRIQDKKLCDVLLDQAIISGIGNYMRADILYLAQLNPYSIIGEMEDSKFILLWNLCQEIAWESYYQQATTCGNYESSIHTGNYQPKIYGRQKCPKGFKVETAKSKGRTIHWVPEIQIF